MTILIGLLCEDGIVIGSDSSTTFTGGAGLRTIEQVAPKVFQIGEDLIFAGTGSVGLGQRFRAVLERKKADFKSKTNVDVGRLVSEHFIKDMAETRLNPGLYGALVGFLCQGKPYLIEFDTETFQPEMKSSEMWFCSMGSGQPIADPFLAFIAKVLFQGKRPTLREGIFAAYWALQQAIELNTGGINGPPQIATLAKVKDKDKYVAKLLSNDVDLSEHPGLVRGVEDCIREYRAKLSGSESPACATTTTTPPPPSPPAVVAAPKS